MGRRRSTAEPASAPQTDAGIQIVPGAKGFSFNLASGVWSPPADVFESPDAIVIKMELPGIDPDDLEITLDQSLLIVRGRRRRGCEEHGLVYHLVEIRHGAFERAFELPRHLDLQDIRAEYKEGYLFIVAPKQKRAPRVVPIES